MSDRNRNPSAPVSGAVPRNAVTRDEQEPAALNADGFDTRSFASLSPSEQLAKLEADGKRTAAEQRSRREAYASLQRAQEKKEVKP